jgi:hypothetical protein
LRDEVREVGRRKPSRVCNICHTSSTSEELYQKHLASKGHKRAVAKKDSGDASDGDIIILEDDVSRREPGKGRGAGGLEAEGDREGDCADCGRPVYDLACHLRDHHPGLVISCKPCLQVTSTELSIDVIITQTQGIEGRRYR